MVGVDLSQGMIDLARREEENRSSGDRIPSVRCNEVGPWRNIFCRCGGLSTQLCSNIGSVAGNVLRHRATSQAGLPVRDREQQFESYDG